MRRAEGVVHVEIAERGESAGKGRVVLLFLRVEAEILQQ